VHRDLKPSNILLTEYGVPKLADMGLAILAHRKDLRLTAPGMAIGTPTYMSPEQARAEREIDARSDIYSLGCTIYHAICGRPPIEGPNAIIIAQKHLTVRPRPPIEVIPTLNPAISDILMHCLEKDPADRYQTCAELKAAIVSALDAPATGSPSGRTPVPSGRTAEANSPQPAAEDAPPEAEPADKRPSSRVHNEFLFSKTPVPGKKDGDVSNRSALPVRVAEDRRPSPAIRGGPPTPIPISEAGLPGPRRGIDTPRSAPRIPARPRQNPARRALELVLGIGAILAATIIIWLFYK
jgi:serine/threonine protein kinase